MSIQPTFNPRDCRYKAPYGAVAAGTAVQFTLRPPRAGGFSRGLLTARFESREDQLITLPMAWTGSAFGRDEFSCTLETGAYVGLIWYSLVLEGLDGRRQTCGEYQLTVYDDTHAVPAWFGQGLTYQIFPDRFRRTKTPDPAGLAGGRWVHQSWQEQPEYRPDQRGEVRNRDFFGGDLMGVIEKLDYLKGLGVETIYLNPIFEAAENHRYGTADYTRVDPMLGDNETFAKLCKQAHEKGMRVILDGVFNHTGFVSRYFNGDGFYPDQGASQSWDSPYRPWFQFIRWPGQYESWWGIYSLPAVNEAEPSYREFIFAGENSVVRQWLRAGADGWRLDVADELPDDFVAGIHQAARAEKPDAVVVGEVWEDGSNKVAYGVRRKHILGGHCDGLMNYPLRRAILAFFQGGDGADFVEQMETLRENYPASAFYSAMNCLGTHDTPRILTLLGALDEHREQSKQWRADFRLSEQQRQWGKQRLMAAALLLYTFPGSPTLYYGDEAGMEGFEDPFNRQTYPWGYEDAQLLDWFRALGQLRAAHPALRRGSIRYLTGDGAWLVYVRRADNEEILCVFHAGDEPDRLRLEGELSLTPLLGEGSATCQDGDTLICMSPRAGATFLVDAQQE
jgi:glycosidase